MKKIIASECLDFFAEFETDLRNQHLSFLKENPFDMLSALTELYSTKTLNYDVAEKANRHNCMGRNIDLVTLLNDRGLDSSIAVSQLQTPSGNPHVVTFVPYSGYGRDGVFIVNTEVRDSLRFITQGESLVEVLQDNAFTHHEI